ncbi:protein IQ-domain 26-like [Rutidosis leptorrhynchoides]|uniref:protein IQ-domain 26-like n=1 Tax=Rutidosis leptorrhynchoides TaxID=125765 RepID=UPI003A99DB6C
MGKTSRWLKALFGFNKKENNQTNSGHRKEKISSCIGRSRRTPTLSTPETPMTKPLYSNYSNEINRRAMAVAAATSKAADAAIAAAHAAFDLVKVTSQNHIMAGDREISAAIKIQAMFRGYLSRKALKALKSLVRLQAVVRGFLVRKLLRARFSISSNRFCLQDDKCHSRRSIRASEGRSRRMSYSSQIPNNGRLGRLEVEPEEAKSRLARTNTWAWAAGSRVQTPSPLFSNSRRLSMPYHEIEPRFSTIQNSPRFPRSCDLNGYAPLYDGTMKDGSFTSDPNYMANTESFRAKIRSQSVPKQIRDFGFGLTNRAGL